MSPITGYDTLAVFPTRVGGTYLNRDALTNSDDFQTEFFNNVTTATIDVGDVIDMCVHQGNLWVIHHEEGTGGPYVDVWDGSTLTQAGGSVDPRPALAAGHAGDATTPSRVAIASDGTDVYVAYLVRISETSSGSCPGFDNHAAQLVMRKWNGATWTFLNSFTWDPALVVGASPPATCSFNIWTFSFAPALTASNGLAWAYMVASKQGVPTSFNESVIIRSDGGTVAEPPTLNPFGRRVRAYTGSDGNPYAVFCTGDGSALTVLNLDDGTSHSTPVTDLYPLDSSTSAGSVLIADAVQYMADQVLISSSEGDFIGAQDGSTGFATVDGHAPPAGFNSGFVAVDSVDPRAFWTGNGPDYPDGPVGYANPTAVLHWAPACPSDNVPVTSYNPFPSYKFWQFGSAGTDGIFPSAVDAQLNAPPNNTYFSDARAEVIGDHLYVAIVAGSFSGTGTKYDAQMIVYDQPICRQCGTCTVVPQPVMRSRHRAEPAGAAGTTFGGDSAVKVFNQTEGFKVA